MREMQDPETGVPVRSQKLFLTSIPSAFMGKLIFCQNCSRVNACTALFDLYWEASVSEHLNSSVYQA